MYCFVGTTRNARRQAEPQNAGAEKLLEHMQVMDLADGGPAWLVDIDAASFVRLRSSATRYSLPYLLHDEGAAMGVAGDMLPDMELRYETTSLLPSGTWSCVKQRTCCTEAILLVCKK